MNSHSRTMVFLSDTHGRHAEIRVPDGDFLIHAGDFSRKGQLGETQAFMDWFSALPHPHKILIAGNHDFIAEREPGLFRSLIPENVIYLEDSGAEVEGIHFWGSPMTPTFFNWAFNRDRGQAIRKHWEMIPEGTDVLITHGPPYSILDQVQDGRPVGCRDLLHRILEVRPRVHVFGHIHEAFGRMRHHDMVFMNASNLNLEYQPVNPAFTLQWPLQDVSLNH